MTKNNIFSLLVLGILLTSASLCNAQNILYDGDFSTTTTINTYIDGPAPNNVWFTWQDLQNKNSVTVVGGVCKFDVVTLSTEQKMDDIQLIQTGFPLIQGHSYRLSFDVKADANRSFGFSLGENGSPWTSIIGYDKYIQYATTDWKTISIDFIATSVFYSHKISFELVAEQVVTYFDNVMLVDLGMLTPSIGILGTALNGWIDDIYLQTTNDITYTLENYTFKDGYAKFRQDNDWSINWGDNTFPSGTGIQDGPDIPVSAGIYNITFNRLTGEYSFTGTTSFSITCPSNKTVNTVAGSNTAIVNDLDPIVTPISATYNYTLSGATTGNGSGSASGRTFNEGETTVTYTMIDDVTKSCSFKVTVIKTAIVTGIWQSIEAGYSSTFGIKNDGTLWAWGKNTFSGQLGDGTTINRNTPVQIGTATDWKTVSPGNNHTVGLKIDGTLWAWGVGQLGDENIPWSLIPVQIGTSKWQSVLASYFYTLGIKTDGTLWAWGSGPLGNETITYSTIPLQIGTESNWKSISADANHAVGLKTDGTLWAWGNNGTGSISKIPVQVGTSTDWKSASTGSYYTIGLKNNGTLWAWGYNAVGQLGDGTYTDKKTPVQVGTATNWGSVTAKGGHTAALKTDGSLWAWGYNGSGELGDGTLIGKASPIQIGTATDWQSISAGGGYTIGLKADCTQYSATGNNSDGQLGDGSTIAKKSFECIIGPASFSISCPADKAAFTDGGNCTAVVNDIDPVVSPLGAKVSHSLSGATTGNYIGSLSGGTFNKGVTTATYTLIDDTSKTCSFTVTVTDNQAPVLRCPSNQTLEIIANTTAANYTIPDPILGYCSDSTWGYVLTGATTGTKSSIANDTGSGVLSFNKGVTTVTLSGTDGTNISTTCSFTVTVIDNQTPVLVCPDNQTLNVIANSCSASYGIADPISDNSTSGTWGYTLTGATTGTLSGIADDTGSSTLSFNKGVTTVTLDGTDGTNSATTCSFTVTVSDNQAPVLACPSNQTLNVIANTSAANYTIVDPIYDNCIGSSWGYVLTGATTGALSSIADGTGSGVLSFNKGITTVTLSGTDGTNIATTCSFTVTVTDDQAPVLACPDNQTLNVIANTCAANYTIADPISDNTIGSTWGYALTGATTGIQSGIADGTGSGVLSFNKGITTVTLNGTDGTNSASSCSFTVMVTDDQKPTITAPLAVNVAADAGKCTASGISLGTPTAIDNCSEVRVTNNASEPFSLGETMVIWTATDGSGNTATAIQIVTVNVNVTIGTVSGTTPLCKGAIATYTSNGDTGGIWSSSDTSVATVNASSGLVTTLSAGTTQITYTLSGCTGPVAAFKSLTVNTAIGPTMFATGATTVCQDAANETYTATAGGSASIVYSVLPISAGTLGVSSGVMNWDPAFSGNATITATSTGLCGTTSADREVIVNPLPIANAGLPSTVIPGNSIIIGTTAVEGNTYSWVSNPAGFTSAFANPTVSPLVTTTYTLTVSKTSVGCSNSDSVTITVANQLPVANAGADKTVYYGYPPSQCTTLYGSASGGTPPYQYSWSNGVVAISTSVCPTTTTIYTLTVTDAKGYSVIDDVTVNVIDVSCENNKVMVCHENKTVCIAIPAVKAHLAHGDFLGDCNYNSSIAVNPVSVNNSLVLYPNPTTGSFTIEVRENNVVERAILQVIDFNGQIIYSKAPFRIDGYLKETIQLNHSLPDGIYFVQLITGYKTETRELIFKK